MVGAPGPRALLALTSAAALTALAAPQQALAHHGHCLEPPPVQQSGSDLRVTQIATAGTTTDIARAPGDPRHLYLSQREGIVSVLDTASGALRPFLDLSAE